MKQESTAKQFLKESEYWVEVRHEDYCGFCKDGIRKDCALAPSDLKRVRVAQFIYFTEALDYAQTVSKRGVSAYVRKPRFQDGKTHSEFSFYPAQEAN